MAVTEASGDPFPRSLSAMVRHLLKDSAVYGIGAVLSRLVGFVMIPVYTRVLTPSDYGVIETITRVADVFGLVMALGIAGSLQRFYSDAKDDGERRALASTAMVLLSVITAAGILVHSDHRRIAG